MKIYIAADHAGFKLKEKLEEYLINKGHKVIDLGNDKLEKTDDYTDFAKKVAEKVAIFKEKGILLCGNAEGVCITANKTRGIRAALGFSQEAAKTTREDDNANILCLPGRMMDIEEAIKITETFINTPFSGEERHVRRLKKLEEIENENMK